jgi:hypothetical protein
MPTFSFLLTALAGVNTSFFSLSPFHTHLINATGFLRIARRLAADLQGSRVHRKQLLKRMGRGVGQLNEYSDCVRYRLVDWGSIPGTNFCT